jgi:hypothetical protein
MSPLQRILRPLSWPKFVVKNFEIKKKDLGNWFPTTGEITKKRSKCAGSSSESEESALQPVLARFSACRPLKMSLGALHLFAYLDPCVL